jgi:hypothetical protein
MLELLRVRDFSLNCTKNSLIVKKSNNVSFIFWTSEFNFDFIFSPDCNLLQLGFVGIGSVK